jgi:hypothetical protein
MLIRETTAKKPQKKEKKKASTMAMRERKKLFNFGLLRQQKQNENYVISRRLEKTTT